MQASLSKVFQKLVLAVSKALDYRQPCVKHLKVEQTSNTRPDDLWFWPCRVLSNLFSRVWDIQAAMNYLLSGTYTYSHPLGKLLSHVHWEDPNGKPGCDWLGVNHYAR